MKQVTLHKKWSAPLGISSFFVQCDRTASLPHQFMRWYAIVQMRYSNWEIKSYTEIIQGFFKNFFGYSAWSVSWGIFWNPTRYYMTLFTLPYMLNNSQASCNPLGDSHGHSKGNSVNVHPNAFKYNLEGF